MGSKQQTKKPSVDELYKLVDQLRQELAGLRQQPQPQPQPRRKSVKGQPRADVFYTLLAVPPSGLPPQAIACARILATAADSNRIPESEAMELIVNAHKSGRLKTTQDAWHIFQYYRPKLIEKDYLRMSSE